METHFTKQLIELHNFLTDCREYCSCSLVILRPLYIEIYHIVAVREIQLYSWYIFYQIGSARLNYVDVKNTEPY